MKKPSMIPTRKDLDLILKHADTIVSQLLASDGHITLRKCIVGNDEFYSVVVKVKQNQDSGVNKDFKDLTDANNYYNQLRGAS